MGKCLKYLLRKEFIQFRRNKFLPRLLFVYPIAVMLIVPLIANMDVKGVNVAVVDKDASTLSQRVISHIRASGHFKLRLISSDYDSAFRLLEDGRVDVLVSLPEGFELSLARGVLPKVNIDANSVNATKSGMGSQYVVMTVARAISEMAQENGIGASFTQRDISVRYFYNETLDYRFYMIPAFVIILVLMVCCFIPALNLVVEKEKGTIEQINVTPVTKPEFILSKLIPYWLIGLVVMTEGILTAGLAYGLWPIGNAAAIYLAAIIFVLSMSSFALIVANGSSTMQQSIFVLFFFVMIFMLMSGLLTPVASMPKWAQRITLAFPTRYFIDILRAIYLKGTSIIELKADYLALTAFALVMSLSAAVSYRKQQ